MRAFVALEVPEQIRRRLEPLGQELRKLNLHGRVVAVESVHLTLKFLGEIEPGQVSDIASRLGKRLVRHAPFQLEVKGLGVFPGVDRPRVVWVGIEKSGPLEALQEEVEKVLEELDFARESRPFHAHLTLARLKSRRNLARLARFLGEPAARESLGRFSVREVILFESSLGPSGARYLRRAAALLGKG